MTADAQTGRRRPRMALPLSDTMIGTFFAVFPMLVALFLCVQATRLLEGASGAWPQQIARDAR